MEKIKAVMLIRNYDIYPRSEINRQKIADYKEALRSGVVFPAVIADRKTKETIDGFHRIESFIAFYGATAEIDVEFRDYKNVWEQRLDAARSNCGHGMQYDHYSQTRCLIWAIEHGEKKDKEEMANALNITLQRVEKLIGSKTAIDQDDKIIPIKRTIRHLAGTKLTSEQIIFNEKEASGKELLKITNELINGFKRDAIDWGNQQLIDALKELRNLLQNKIREVS